jgi:hypothetical protein
MPANSLNSNDPCFDREKAISFDRTAITRLLSRSFASLALFCDSESSLSP